MALQSLPILKMQPGGRSNTESQVATCISHALSIGEIVWTLNDLEGDESLSLQSVWAAAAMLSAANTFLWIQYASDPEFSDAHTVSRADIFFELISSMFRSWADQWTVAQRWLAGVEILQATYRAAYRGVVAAEVDAMDSNANVGADGDAETVDNPGFRPVPGEGFPRGYGVPYLYSSIRMIAIDRTATHDTLHSVWITLAGGWTQTHDFDLLSAPRQEEAGYGW